MLRRMTFLFFYVAGRELLVRKELQVAIRRCVQVAHTLSLTLLYVIHWPVTGSITVRLQGGSRQTSSRIAVIRTAQRSFNLRRIPILFTATSQRALRHGTVTSVKRGIVFLWNTTCGYLVKSTSIYRRNVEKISSSLSPAIIVIIMRSFSLQG